ncbi:class I SAM-dependent rRNA methyltransferase [Cryomorpha ignava]|uniref:Class I SAM-dependent rRNA methyltransferase n=1 Tax=Cryomorpha ignava TaxID=101383 RepID=A0A7K3WUK6_9FLAO|nr:class I SAM-dependent rRNA methyltransferase [Cryomorpha ignava]NEN25347.1 class I SAM-dependent rRNA methyltransferase [Cryomorpha ignava]
MSYPILKLKSGKTQSISRRHPWIFSGALQFHKFDLKNGDVIYIANHQDNILATAHFSDGSIAARILAFAEVEINSDFYAERIKSAFAIRSQSGLTNSDLTNAYRLINAEGDQLPGLVIDFYNGVAVVQTHSAGMTRDFELIKEALHKTLGNRLNNVVHKSAEKSNTNLSDDTDIPPTINILEHGNVFVVNHQTGQKTGFFLDQRENRALSAKYAKGKRVLNAFCYSGGFSIYALKAGAEMVHSLDSSAKAMQLVDENLEANSLTGSHHQSITADALEYLNSDEARDQDYDVIILDPPAFAKHRSARHKAVQAYKRLNARALSIMKPGGILITFSCSQVVTPDLFNNTIAAAAIEANRHVRILHHLHQPEDHPISIFHPEGEYLKGLVLAVS